MLHGLCLFRFHLCHNSQVSLVLEHLHVRVDLRGRLGRLGMRWRGCRDRWCCKRVRPHGECIDFNGFFQLLLLLFHCFFEFFLTFLNGQSFLNYDLFIVVHCLWFDFFARLLEPELLVEQILTIFVFLAVLAGVSLELSLLLIFLRLMIASVDWPLWLFGVVDFWLVFSRLDVLLISLQNNLARARVFFVGVEAARTRRVAFFLLLVNCRLSPARHLHWRRRNRLGVTFAFWTLLF